MWSKLTSAIKRPGTPSLSPEDAEPPSLHPDVMGGVYERHPNLSVFHQDASEVPFPSPSPPPSPSKRKGLLKRISKNPFVEHEATSQPPRPNISIPKKVKSSIHSTSTGSDISVYRSAERPSEDTARPSVDSLRPPTTPISESKFGSLRAILKPSLGSNSSASESSLRLTNPTARPNDDALPPATPTSEYKFSSLRSILRPGNTPGTGQSVRFFSRDAYKIITPDISSASELEDPGIEGRFRRGPLIRPAVQELFSPIQNEAPPTPISPIGSDSLMLPYATSECRQYF
ncbi:hypothetical protein QCA50_008035 [Cerrena zonata]|uniref:Uncharacterized protein n=1 Tax=Cerrena zonata TaxID=2478898 RepID=A0AAW0GEU8_9APHY